MSHSDHAQPRQPQGRPAGGQYAEKSRPSSGLSLPEPQDDTYATAEHGGLTASVFDSEVDGSLVVQLDTDQARGRNIRVYINDGTIYDGDPEADETIEQKVYLDSPAGPAYQLNKVMDEYHRMTTRVEHLSAQVVAEVVWRDLPEAKYLSVQNSDQGDHLEGAAILDADRNVIGQWSDVEEAHEDDAVALQNLRADEPHDFLTRSSGGAYIDLDKAARHGRQ